MSGFRTRLQGDTLAAIQARQLALEAQMKTDSKAAAIKVVRHHSEKKEWTEDDTANVLGALGLT
jgi:hypothetical protein